MRVSVIGSGYVGLVTAVCFSEIGNEVVNIDSDRKKIDQLRNNRIPIYEPGLQEMAVRNIKAERLRFSVNIKDVRGTDVVFTAVGTPLGKNGAADVSSVHRVAKRIGNFIEHRTVIVNKSTVPVGTGKKVENIIATALARRRVNVAFSVASNPEFLKEGTAIQDFMHPDRIVLGVVDAWAERIMRQLYAPFEKNGHPILVMTRESSEMSKYASNAMLAAKISFMNQMANFSEVVGANIEEVRQAMSLDSRIGNQFLNAGVGYGGSCFPKDVQAMIAFGRSRHLRVPLLEAIESVNHDQKEVLARKVSHLYKTLRGKTFAVWGLTFKPNTDDMREAPAVTIVNLLLAKGAKVVAYDPQGMSNARQVFGRRIRYAPNMYAACRRADGLLLVTEWSEFRKPDFKKVFRFLKRPTIFDGRNVYDPKSLRALGFEYHGIGR